MLTPVLDLDDLDAVVFDLDGVLTDTARVHAAAWKRLFDDYLLARTRRDGTAFEEFTDENYLAHVDGKPRYDGVSSFLESRGIQLPFGDPSDTLGVETVCGLGNRKDELFRAALAEHGVERFASSVELVELLRARGVRTAVATSSRNGAAVVGQAGLSALFDVLVDGMVLAELGLPGKPHPALFLEALRRLDVEPGRAAVVEDAVSGVQAGRRGAFRLVVGVDRHEQADALRAHGADLVVRDLSELIQEPER
jgi:beta-phosphoglucomutase family hydrolase